MELKNVYLTNVGTIAWYVPKEPADELLDNHGFQLIDCQINHKGFLTIRDWITDQYGVGRILKKITLDPDTLRFLWKLKRTQLEHENA